MHKRIRVLVWTDMFKLQHYWLAESYDRNAVFLVLVPFLQLETVIA